MSMLPYLSAAWILLVGLYGVVRSRHLVQLVACLSVMQSGTYVLLLAIGFRRAATAPVYAQVSGAVKVVDPLVQAMTFTDIVASTAVTALLLMLAVQIYERIGTFHPAGMRPLRQGKTPV